MKNLLSFICVLLALPVFAQTFSSSTIQLMEEDHKSSTIRVQLEGFMAQTVTTQEGEAWIVSIEDGTPILFEGAPDLPKLSTSLMIGDDAAMEVQIESYSYTDYEDIEIAPSKGNLYRDVDPAAVPYTYGEFYDYNTFYPKSLASLSDPFIYRDFRGQTVQVHPIQYNPQTKVLRVYDEIIFKVVQVDGTVENPLVRQQSGPVAVNDDFDKLYQRYFLNYAASGDRYEQIGEVGNMLIISASDYMATMEPYVEWKQQKGVPTEIVDIATVGNSPAEVESFVSDYYNNNGLTYLLLVGDENDIETPETNAGDACDHCYSYTAGNDHFADLFVGRFNAETEEQVQTMVDRTMEYEKTPYVGDDWYGVAAGCGSNEGPGDDGEYDYEHLNNIKVELLDYTYSKVWEYYQGSQANDSPTPGDVTSDLNGNPSTNTVIDHMNEGMSLFNYTGHGNHSSVSTSGFDVDACYDLENTGMYPFMIIVGCCVGDFTGDYGSGDCLGDAWIRASSDITGEPTGGVAGAFASLLQSWAPPMEGQDEMMKLLTESAIYDTRHTVGGIMIHGFASMIEEYGGGGIEMADTWNIFGDPSVTLYTQMPVDMTVTHVPTTFLGTTSLTVNCDVEGAMIGLYYQEELLATGLVENGAVDFDFDPLSFPEPILVTATAFNRMPYQGNVEVIAASGPFVTIDSYQIDDSAGDNDQKADYNESVLMDIDLSNVGVESANDVIATISTTDPAVTIINPTVVVGDIEADQQVNISGAFAFDVSTFITDGQIVTFELLLESPGNSWNGLVNVPLYTPVLSVAPEAQLSDNAGGNGNNRIDPGETLEISIQNLNDGQDNLPAGLANLITASPYVTLLSTQTALTGIGENAQEWTVFEFEVSSDVPKLEPLEFTYAVEADVFTADATFNFLMNPIVEDFESNDFDSFDWQASGTVPWFTTGLDPYEGDVCSQSGDIGHNQTSDLLLVAEVLEDGDVTFSRKVSSEEDWDYLRFYIDGVELGSWSGEQDWQEVSFPVTAGERLFHWAYEKDNFVSEGQDAGWIDEILLPLIDDGSVSTTFISGEAYGLDMKVLPNPIADSGELMVTLASKGDVRIELANINGQILENIFEGNLAEGDHYLPLNVSQFASGTYFVVLSEGEQSIVRQLIVD